MLKLSGIKWYKQWVQKNKITKDEVIDDAYLNDVKINQCQKSWLIALIIASEESDLNKKKSQILINS